MDIQMTNSTRAFLCLIYKEYLNRLQNGATQREACDFESPKKRIDNFLPNAKNPDIVIALAELKQKGLISLRIRNGFHLTSEAIIYMENLFPGGLSDLIAGIHKLASFAKIFLP